MLNVKFTRQYKKFELIKDFYKMNKLKMTFPKRKFQEKYDYPMNNTEIDYQNLNDILISKVEKKDIKLRDELYKLLTIFNKHELGK